METTVLFFAALYGIQAIIFGAFGAHALKKRLGPELLQSFETGVKYQMYHAIVLLILGFNLEFKTAIEHYAGYGFILGVFLFSYSIYGLCFGSAGGRKLRFLGPVTPLGGILLVAAWSLLLAHFVLQAGA